MIDFTIEVAKDVFDAATSEFRYAILDHYIGFIGIRINARTGEPETDEGGRARTFKRRPDVIEFEEVLVRHGAYTSEISSFLRAFADRRQKEKEIERERKKREREAAKTATPEEANLIEDLVE